MCYQIAFCPVTSPDLSLIYYFYACVSTDYFTWPSEILLISVFKVALKNKIVLKVLLSWDTSLFCRPMLKFLTYRFRPKRHFDPLIDLLGLYCYVV